MARPTRSATKPPRPPATASCVALAGRMSRGRTPASAASGGGPCTRGLGKSPRADRGRPQFRYTRARCVPDESLSGACESAAGDESSLQQRSPRPQAKGTADFSGLGDVDEKVAVLQYGSLPAISIPDSGAPCSGMPEVALTHALQSVVVDPD